MWHTRHQLMGASWRVFHRGFRRGFYRVGQWGVWHYLEGLGQSLSWQVSPMNDGAWLKMEWSSKLKLQRIWLTHWPDRKPSRCTPNLLFTFMKTFALKTLNNLSLIPQPAKKKVNSWITSFRYAGIFLITYKALHSLAPTYLSELLTVYDPAVYDLKSLIYS